VDVLSQGESEGFAGEAPAVEWPGEPLGAMSMTIRLMN
jgi:hypothetical protein